VSEHRFDTLQAGDRVVGQAFCHQREHLAFAIGESAEGVAFSADE
jgi:hypothetical protein